MQRNLQAKAFNPDPNVNGEQIYNNFSERQLQGQLQWLVNSPINIEIFPKDNYFIIPIRQLYICSADIINEITILRAGILNDYYAFTSPLFSLDHVFFVNLDPEIIFFIDNELIDSDQRNLYFFLQDTQTNEIIFQHFNLILKPCDDNCAPGQCAMKSTNCQQCPLGFEKIDNSETQEFNCARQCQQNQFREGLDCIDCLSPCATCSSLTTTLSDDGCLSCIQLAQEQSFREDPDYCESITVQNFGKFSQGNQFFLQVYPFQGEYVESYVFDDFPNTQWITIEQDQSRQQIKLTIDIPSNVGEYYFDIRGVVTDFRNPKQYRGYIEVVDDIIESNGILFQEYLSDMLVLVDQSFTLSEEQICRTQDGFPESLQQRYSYRQDTDKNIWISISEQGVGPFSIQVNPSGAKALKIENKLNTFYGVYEVRQECQNQDASVEHIYSLSLVQNSAPEWESEASLSLELLDTSTTLTIDLTDLFIDDDLPEQAINTFSVIASTNINQESLTNLLYAPGNQQLNKVMISDNYQAIFEVSRSIPYGSYSIYFWIQDSREAKSSPLKGSITVIRDCWSTCDYQKCTQKSELKCTVCKPGLVFHTNKVGQKKCYASCLNEEYDDFDSSQCIKCTQGCLSCKGPGLNLKSTNCQQCSLGWYITGPSTDRFCSQSCGTGYTYDTGSYECYQTRNPRFIQPYPSILNVKKGDFIDYIFQIDPQNELQYSVDFKIYSGSVAKNNLVDLSRSEKWIQVFQIKQIQEQGANIMPDDQLLNIIQLGTPEKPVPGVQKEFIPEEYLVRFELTQSPDQKKSTVDIAINLMTETAPRLKAGISTDIGDMTPNVPFTYLIKRDFFIAREGSTLTLSCRASNSSFSWILFQRLGGDIQVSATVPNNTFVNSNIEIQCSISNSDNDISIVTFRADINRNKAPLWLNQLSDKTLYLNENFTVALSPFCNDPEGDSLQFGAQVNGQQINGRQKASDNIWFDRTTSRFSFSFTNNSQIGVSNIQISCQDNFNQPILQSFKIISQPNRPPTLLKSIPDIRVDIFTKNYDMQLTQYFTDPEGGALNYKVVSQSQSQSSTIAQINSNGQLALTLDNSVQGIQYLTLIATDNQMSPISANFKLIVQGCSTGCTQCFGLEKDQCSQCSANLALQNNQCVSSCASGTYLDTQDKKCKLCPDKCKSCFGSNEKTQCSECKPDYYFFNNGCGLSCPSGYYEDESSSSCKIIDSEQTQNYQKCLDFIQSMGSSEILTDNEAKPISVLASKDYQCQSQACTGKITSDCKWKRKFALQCGRSQDGFATLRIQTNSLPNHCIVKGSSVPQEGNIDFSVKFDIPVSNQVTLIKSSSIANDYRCSDEWLHPEQIPQVYDFRSFETDDDLVRDIIGVALNGVPILQSLTAEAQDFFSPSVPSPQTSSALQKLDSCLGGYETQGFYSYFSASHCILNGLEKSQSIQGLQCSELQPCRSSPMSYMQQNFESSVPSENKVQKIAIAKDGHFIVGPFNTQGKLWQPCEVDFCNGAIVDGSYVYASTMFYPYTVGCWGPSTSNLFPSSCSLQSQVCQSDQLLSNSIYLLARLEILLLIGISIAYLYIL